MFDDDNSGKITRAELKAGIERMNIALSQSLLTNLFKFFDSNNDNEISMEEFEAVLAKHFGAGEPVEVKSAAEYMEDIEGLTAEEKND